MSNLVVFNENTETTIEIAADGSAAVIVRPVGNSVAKTSDKAPAKRAPHKSKAAAKEVGPEPQNQKEAEAEAPAENLDQTEVPGATRVEEPAAEAPAPQAVSKSVFSLGSKVKDIQEDAPAAPAETPRPVGASIFSKVGKAG